MAQTKRVPKDVEDLAKKLGYEVWREDADFWARNLDNKDVAGKGDTARAALDEAFRVEDPETPSICDEHLGDKVVKLRTKTPKVEKPKVDRAHTGVEYAVHHEFFAADAKKDEERSKATTLLDTVTKAGFTTTSGTVNNLRTGSVKRNMIIREMKAKGELPKDYP